MKAASGVWVRREEAIDSSAAKKSVSRTFGPRFVAASRWARSWYSVTRTSTSSGGRAASKTMLSRNHSSTLVSPSARLGVADSPRLYRLEARCIDLENPRLPESAQPDVPSEDDRAH